MADLDQLNQRIDFVTERFEKLNHRYIRKVAKQILKIGQLNQSSINRLIIMQRMNQDMGEIKADLAKQTDFAIEEITRIFDEALTQTYTDPRFKDVIEETPLTESQRRTLINIAQNIAIQTAQRLVNYSNTTAVTEDYRKTVDQAVLAVTSGVTDYNSAMRQAIRDLGYNGLRIEYESGYHRRLDSAIRQNIVDGVNQIAQLASLRLGEIYGDDFDAIELSAHAMCAPDHEPVQGRVFLLAEFDHLQSYEAFTDINGKHYKPIKRPIGQWNCRHIAMAFSTKYNKPRYTEEQLQEFEQKNKKNLHQYLKFRKRHFLL